MKLKTTGQHQDISVFKKLTRALHPLIKQSAYIRKCNKLSDVDWIETGILRSIFQEPSGRGFLQSLLDMGRGLLKPSHFFESLKSKRRLRLCQDVNSLLLQQLPESLNNTDPLKDYPELDGYDIYAGDGHYHSASVHDIKTNGKKYPTLHFYSLDLRTHGLNHMTVADTKDNRKTEHDMRALKRIPLTDLRQNAPKGRKVIYVWDRAGIDFQQWYKWKKGGGIYFISREKKNMRLTTIADLKVDHSSSVNNGVDSHELVGPASGVAMSRIKYTCPLTGATFTFLTNLTNIPPGLIAYLYKLRWDIEKVFDQVKNKMIEKKAWAASDTAKTMQAEFVCLAHNLMLLLEGELKEEGIENVVELKRQAQRFQEEIETIQRDGKQIPVCLFKITRFTQRSIRFIRWLRNSIFTMASWRAAVPSLRLAYADFQQ